MSRNRTWHAALVLLIAAALQAAPAKPKPKAKPKTSKLDSAKTAMRGRHFDDAVGLLNEVIAAKADADGEAMYLKALAQHYANKHADAVKSADALIAARKTSPWLRKAVFLKAMALIQQRKFKPAEAIYEAEAGRLLSDKRKREIAGVIIKFADALATKPAPDDLAAPPPNYGKAYNLYGKALAMEIGRDLRDQVMFKRARTIQSAGNHAQAIKDYRAYLAEFDPDWTGTVGSATRLAGQKREKPKPAGKHPLQARFHLAEVQLRGKDHRSARVNLEDLLSLLAARDDAKKLAKLTADARWQLVRTYRLPNPASGELDRAIKTAGDFCKTNTDDPHAVVAAWWIAQAYQAHGRADQAIAAYEAFIAGKNYRLPAGEAATKKLETLKLSPAKLHDQWLKLAVYNIGRIRFGQKKYDDAVKAWQEYVKKYPNGPQWSACQQAMIDAEFQVAVDAVADKKYEDARKLFEAFLTKHPLDGRARQILFTVGQIDYAQAQKLEADKGGKADKKEINASYQRAIDRWDRLVSKYPNTEESSLALYRIALIYEEKLGNLDKALDAYRRLTWGSYASRARARLAVMTRKDLRLRTERKYRTNEAAKVQLKVRNIEKLTFKQYFLDLEAYFRKTHAIGRVDRLDIELIQPDKTWEVKIDDYAKYKPIEQAVEIPFAKGAAGVCIINVGEDDLEATTLVIRSDLDIIVKSSRREALVFVQDMLANKPAEGVSLLLSDGKKVFATGKTGKDGVFRGGFDELKTVGSLGVFASRKGSVASNALSLGGLKFSSGLSAKGYIYTDRSAYQPGQTVAMRGIIRDVANGSYVAPKGKVYSISITDAGGRLIWEQPATLSEFGTFHMTMALSDRVPLGRYAVTARSKADEKDGKKAYTSTFLVQRFKLEKMRLKLTTDRKVYFRGETVKLTIQAEYYWGQPVANKPIKYNLPDGRSFVQKTDAKGKLAVTCDTSGMRPGRVMVFAASIEGENVVAAHRAMLALQGFGIAVKPSRALVLAGEPFDVEIKTAAPDGKPVGKPVTLLVLRTHTPKADPVLGGVPWIRAPKRQAAEVTVLEKKAVTDAKTGKATVNLTLEKGGRYILRATGEDRFKQVVTSQGAVQISDDDDATKLRFFAKADTLQVGAATSIRLHSRLAAELALLTFEGEEIISYRVLNVKKGYNPIALKVGHEHFPNFRVAVAVIDGRSLRSAAKPFTVERQLNVTVKPLKDVYKPGEPGKVELTVTDQLGKPVRGELSLALIDEALFAIYPDATPKIRAFFQRGAYRHAEFRAAGTCSFQYDAATRKVIKAYQDEKQRLLARAQEAKDFKKVQALRKELATRGRVARAPARPMTDSRIIRPGQSGERLHRIAGGLDKLVAANGKPVVGHVFGRAKGGRGGGGGGKGPGGWAVRARAEMPEAGRWLPQIVTDKNGKAVVDVPMPETTTQWRLTSRGCTVETLVGQATANVITRKDFFVEIKAPQLLQEGDTVRVLARVHNLTDYAGPVELKLTVLGGEDLTAKQLERKHRLTVKKRAGGEALFEGFDVPLAAALKIRVDAKAGKNTDALATTVGVRPWGLELADHAGGVAQNVNAAVDVELPAGRKYASKWMMVSVGPDLKRSVIDMALHGGPRPVGRLGRCGMPPPLRMRGLTGSDLLATVSAMKYARAVDAPRLDHQRLTDRARSLVSALVVSQYKDGGWNWTRTSAASNWAVTAVSFWALCEARDNGIVVHAATLAKAQKFLKDTYARVSANDNDAKAVLLHALSANNAADFAHANRLHRERNALSAPALAYTALALANLKRNEFAAELLDVLAKKAKPFVSRKRQLVCWPAAGCRHPWMNDDVETTALTALALMRVKPNSPRIRPAVDYLLRRRGTYGFVPAKAHGPAVRALAAYFETGKFAQADYTLTVLVNGKKVRTIAAKGAKPSVAFAVPRDLIGEGKNLVEFRLAGRGEYAYAVTLRGFSSDMKDPKSWRYPYVHARHYRHATLEYRGKPIGASSTSPVKHIEIGQRVRVYVDLYHTSSSSRYKGYLVVEEHLPAGMMLVAGSLSGRFVHHEVHASKIVMYYPPGRYLEDFYYELIGYSTGKYRVLPTVIRDTVHPGRMRVGGTADLVVLRPGEKSDDPYKMNDAERYALGVLYFNDGLYKEAMRHLSDLFKRNRAYNEREVARMLLWIYTAEGFYDAKQIVAVFEVLRERYPLLEIPFDKILVVGRAYRDIGEFERAYLVFRATIDASFINDVNVSAVLEDEGQFLGSIDYQEDLWREYPDTAAVSSSYFALSQALYQNAPKAKELAKQARQIAAARGRKPDKAKRKPDKIEMIKEAIRLLSEFLTLYPTNPLADDAAFSMANAMLDLKLFSAVVELCDGYKRHFAGSDFASGFQYMIALGQFWQRNYVNALSAARIVADGKSKDRDFARYILGQIYHAQGKPADAITWYQKVAGQYADAKQAIGYFEAKHVKLEEVNVFRPGKPVQITLNYRNIKEAFCQVYRVDLMKLYLREKNLANITKVNLAGIEPLVEQTIPLGDGRDYVDKKKTATLKLDKEGAYLVICRGDDLFASGLVLVTPLKIEVQEDATSGRVRANVLNDVAGGYVPEVHVKAIGSADTEFRSGETDLRGIFVADGLRGKATVIAREGDARYAFFRGEKWLGAPKAQPRKPRRAAPAQAAPDYQKNLKGLNRAVQMDNLRSFDVMRRGVQKGVQVQQAK